MRWAFLVRVVSGTKSCSYIWPRLSSRCNPQRSRTAPGEFCRIDGTARKICTPVDECILCECICLFGPGAYTDLCSMPRTSRDSIPLHSPGSRGACRRGNQKRRETDQIQLSRYLTSLSRHFSFHVRGLFQSTVYHESLEKQPTRRLSSLLQSAHVKNRRL